MVNDIFPGVREPEPGEDFVPPDPDVPALPRIEPSVADLLEQIARNTAPRDAGVTWYPIFHRLPSVAGEQSFRIPHKLRFITVPDVPRDITLWAGPARDILIGDIPAGEGVAIELPFEVQGVSASWDAGTEGETLTIYLSSRKFEITRF